MVTGKLMFPALFAVIVTATVFTSCGFNQNQIPEQTNEHLRWYFGERDEGKEQLANLKLSPNSLASLYDDFIEYWPASKGHIIDYSTFSNELRLSQQTFLESGTWKLIKEGSTENTLANVPEGYDIQRRFIGNSIVESTQLPGDERPTEASRDCLIDDAHLKLTEQNGYVTEEYILSINAFEMLLVIPKFNNYRLYRNETMKWASEEFLMKQTLPSDSILCHYGKIMHDYLWSSERMLTSEEIVLPIHDVVDKDGIVGDLANGTVYWKDKPFTGYLKSRKDLPHPENDDDRRTSCLCMSRYVNGLKNGFRVCFDTYHNQRLELWKADYFHEGLRVGRNNYYRRMVWHFDGSDKPVFHVVSSWINVTDIEVGCIGLCPD